LDLPEKVRDKIYSFLLIVPHPLFLFQGADSQVEVFAPDRPVSWLSIIYTNRQIALEACSTLYGRNRFHLEDTTAQRHFHLAKSFLDQIGVVNAASLSRLHINFPEFEDADSEPRRSDLETYSLRTLQLFQSKCANLATLELSIYNSKMFRIFMESDELVQEALERIDVQFKAMPSLHNVIIRVKYVKCPTLPTKHLMQKLGWVLLIGDESDNSLA
jgi:hypothetical protein